MAFANKTALGWDPSIKTVINHGKPAYHIKVGIHEYQVKEVLSDNTERADVVVGRATRVFKVEREGKPYALKGVWVEEYQSLEHDIDNTMLEDVEKKFGKEIKSHVSKYLMTPIDSWIVTADGEAGGLEDRTICGEAPHSLSWFRLVSEASGCRRKMGSMETSSSFERENLMKPYVFQNPPAYKWKMQRRRHYRVVFAEVAEPIWTLKKLSDVYKVLKDLSKVLKYLHHSNWVHRDISAGNVYLFSGRGVFGDLEYANVISSDETKVGSAPFMAYEAARQSYQFRPVLSCPDIWPKEPVKPEEHFPTVFRYNPAHDLESVLWLTIYMLSYYVDSSKPETPVQKRHRQKWITFAFPGDPGDANRSMY